MNLSDRIKAPDVPVCTDCGIAKHHTSEQCTQIRIAKAVLAEAKWWFDEYCPTEDPKAYHRVAEAGYKLKLAESLGQQ